MGPDECLGQRQPQQVERLCHIVGGRTIEVQQRIAIPQHQVGQPARVEHPLRYMAVQQAQPQEMQHAVSRGGQPNGKEWPEGGNGEERDRQEWGKAA